MLCIYVSACGPSHLSRVRLSATTWTVAHWAPLSLGFSRQEYWSGLPGPSPGDLPHPGIEPVSLMPPALAGNFFTTSATWEALYVSKAIQKDNSMNMLQSWGQDAGHSGPCRVGGCVEGVQERWRETLYSLFFNLIYLLLAALGLLC